MAGIYEVRAVKMGSGVMIYIPSSIKIGSSIQKLIRRIHRHTDSMESANNTQQEKNYDLVLLRSLSEFLLPWKRELSLLQKRSSTS
jgi:hypothetical protein